MSSPSLEQLRFERAQLQEIQRMLENELQRADEDVMDKDSMITELQNRLRRQQQRLEEEEERARDLERQFTQLASDYTELSQRQVQQQSTRDNRSPRRRPPRASMDDLEWDPGADVLTTASSTYHSAEDSFDEDAEDAEDAAAPDDSMRAFERADSFYSTGSAEPMSPPPRTAATPPPLTSPQPTNVVQAQQQVQNLLQMVRSEFERKQAEQKERELREQRERELRRVQDRLDEQQAEIERLQRTLFERTPLSTRSSAAGLVAESLETLKTCVYCSCLFAPEERLPCLRAPRKHTGRFERAGHGLVMYSCCQALSADAPGCVQTAHSDTLPLRARLPSRERNLAVSSSQGELVFSTVDASSPLRLVHPAAIMQALGVSPMTIEGLLHHLIPGWDGMPRAEQNPLRAKLRTMLFDLESSDRLLVNIKDENIYFHLRHAK